MKLKRKVYYWVECPGYWFESKRGHKSSSKHANTAKRAFSIALGLKQQFPAKIVRVTKFFFRKGKRYATDYELL